MRGLRALVLATACSIAGQAGAASVIFDFVPGGSFSPGQENFSASITVDEADVAAGSAAATDVDLLVTFTAVPAGIPPLDITLTTADLNSAGSNHTLMFSADGQMITAFAEDIPGVPTLADAWLLTQSFNPPGEPSIDVDTIAILRADEVDLESLITQAGNPDPLLDVQSTVDGIWARRATAPVIPEPSAALLLLTGAAVIGLRFRTSKRLNPAQ